MSAASDFERITLFQPAYDRTAEGYGIHGVDLLMLLKGALGATQFRLFTGWMLPETVGVPSDEPVGHYGGWHHKYSEGLAAMPTSRFNPTPADLGYHSPRPIYEGQDIVSRECEYVPGGGPCYYDGSGLNAERPFEALLRGGSEGVWACLEDYYHSVFEREEVAA